MKRPALFAALVIVLCAAAFVLYRMYAAEHDALVAHKSFEASSARALADANTLPDRVEPPAPVQHTTRDILKEYWGDRWPEIEAELKAKGYELDRPATCRPWEQAAKVLAPLMTLTDVQQEGYVADHVRWPDDLTIANLAKATGIAFKDTLTMEQIANIQMIADPYNIELREKGEEWTARLKSVVETAWKSGQFTTSPLILAGFPKHRAEPVYVTSHAGGGWTAAFGIYVDDHPEFPQLEKEISELRSKRNAEIYRYVQTL